VVPLAARAVAAAVGVILILITAQSVIGTLIVPRSVGSRLTYLVDILVDSAFRMAVGLVNRWRGPAHHELTGPQHPQLTDQQRLGQLAKAYRRRDRILAAQSSAVLLCQLLAWLGIFFVGFTLLLWPFVNGGITMAFATAGPGLWGIGDYLGHGAVDRTILDIAALTSVITITLQISYLPTLYAEFNRRETEIALLNARAGVPSWGPELLARTHYALGSGISTINTLPDLYEAWERWSADVAESHTTYLPLVRFRSPRPLSSWVTALLAVLDSAALVLSLAPKEAPEVAARLCLRAGFQCFNEVAAAMGLDIPEPDPDDGIELSYTDFLAAVDRMREVDFPIERDPALAWPEFVGWRINYEKAAYAIAYAIDAVPALWSGPRRFDGPFIPPIRPNAGRMSKEKYKFGKK
jgi:hypothetical protein